MTDAPRGTPINGDLNDVLLVDAATYEALWPAAVERATEILGERPHLTMISASTLPDGGWRGWYFYEPHPKLGDG